MDTGPRAIPAPINDTNHPIQNRALGHHNGPIATMPGDGQIQSGCETRILPTATGFDRVEGPPLVLGKGHHTTCLTSITAHRRNGGGAR